MGTNDQIALEANYKHWLETRGDGLTDVKPFNYYAVENFLKSYPVNDQEIRFGIVDKSQDGGVDAFFFFANRKYVFEDPELDPEAEYRVSLLIFQCKEGSGFSPVEIGKQVFFTDDLLDLNRTETDYGATYHSDLKKLMGTFKEQYTRIAGSVPNIDIQYFYISKLDCPEPEPNSDVKVAEKRVEEAVHKHFAKATYKYNYINAPKLLAQAQLRRARSKMLPFASQTITPKEGWIGLVSLSEFYQFVQDEHGDFHESILEENVRGYLRRTPVNAGISNTLKDPDAAEFWLLNNGVTILAEEINPGSSGLTIKDPQIVNGMQTSRSIFEYYKSLPAISGNDGSHSTDTRRILVRVIETKDSSVRDQITRATNSQNTMPPEALRVTDQIHRSIENLFLQFDLYYDRRKGYHKDQGRPVAKIISVRSVLQSMLAIPLRRPDDARARPADYLNDDDKYMSVFAPDGYNLNVYLKCVQLLRKAEAYTSSEILDFKKHQLNLQFYAVLIAAAKALGNAHVPAKDLTKFDLSLVTDELLEESYQSAHALYMQNGGEDKSAKGAAMREATIKLLDAEIHGE